jgi:hypothetical protein
MARALFLLFWDSDYSSDNFIRALIFDDLIKNETRPLDLVSTQLIKIIINYSISPFASSSEVVRFLRVLILVLMVSM